ncbi:MAG: CAP domain-containing protein [Chitinophagaceae bacterium]
MAIIKVFLGLLFFITIFSCQKESVSGKPDGSATTGGVYFNNVNKDVLLALVNEVRKSGCICGTTIMPPVGTVVWNDQLSKAAYDHSKDMFVENYFSHTAENGSNPGARITNAGYTWKSYGENIAKGYVDEQAVMSGWLSSEGHCKNIMTAAFKEMGAGREASYWTQEFGAR